MADTPMTYPCDVTEAAIRSMAVIWFAPDGTILDCNQLFLGAMGYERDEIVGQKHTIFVSDDVADSFDYRNHWDKLRSGQFVSGTFMRLGKGGRTVWIEASYVPVYGTSGQVETVVKLAAVVTNRIEEGAIAASKIAAVDRSQAVIEFELDGTIVDANDNFLSCVGYGLDEIRGKHHSIFVTEEERDSADYQSFWEALGRGRPKQGEFRRKGRDGQDVWLQATYSPILGPSGNPVRIVKFASEITQGKAFAIDATGQIEALNRSQAVVAFDPDGVILSANENFLRAMGYVEHEVVGKHHSLFVSQNEAKSQEYKDFWSALREGEFRAAQFERHGKDGRSVWIQATYNPVFDIDGKVVKVVKFATDVSGAKKAISAFEQAMVRLAGGDLSVRMDGDFSDEFSVMSGDFNFAIESASTLVSRISSGAERVLDEVIGISASAKKLRDRTERQRKAIEATSQSISQVTETMGDTAASALIAQDAAATASGTSDTARRTMSDASSAMGEISASAKQVAAIVSVIEDIAFQTNLLALNAGVEAARAGESGLGFAVVASEVRALSKRTSAAAREIGKLIRDSNDQVNLGSDRVREAEAALHSVVTVVEDIHARITDIALSAGQQAEDLGTLNGTVAELDASTQENTAMFDETSAATTVLTDEMRQLTERAAVFTFITEREERPGVKPPEKKRA